MIVDSAPVNLPEETFADVKGHNEVTGITLMDSFLEFDIIPRQLFTPEFLRESMSSLFFDYETIRQMAALYIKLYAMSSENPAFVSVDTTMLKFLFDIYLNTLSANLSGNSRSYDSTLSTLILYPETTALILNNINEVISSKPGLLVD